MGGPPFSILSMPLLAQLSWHGGQAPGALAQQGSGMEIRHMVRKREMSGRTSWTQVKGPSQGQLHFSST